MDHIAESNTYQKHELLVRMERNNEVIQRLSRKLCSYTYEPRCASHFEKYNELKNNFKMFEKHQKQIMSMIQRKKGGTVYGLDRDIQLHLKRFKQMEGDIADYLLDMGDHI